MAFSYGGPDHNISFLNVMVSWLAFIIMSGCDILVVARTVPTQNWTNHAEQLVFVLKLALLSNCALAKENMGEDFEKNTKKCNSMASFRKISTQLDLLAALVATKGSSARVHVAVSYHVDNTSSSGYNNDARSTEARISGALPIVTSVHQLEGDFDFSQELRYHMMGNGDKECNFPLD